MRKSVLLLIAYFCMGFAACEYANNDSVQPDVPAKPAPEQAVKKVPVAVNPIIAEPAEPSVQEKPQAITEDMRSCDPSKPQQCTLVPEGCMGCMHGTGGHSAVNVKAAENIFKNMRHCEAEFKKLDPQNMQPSSHQSCAYNKAECSSEGVCVLGKMTKEEEKKAREEHERMRKQQGGGRRAERDQ